MSAAAPWLLRLAALVAVALATFTGQTAHGATLAAQLATYGVACLLLVVWALLERHHVDGVLPVVLAALAACSVLTTSTSGGALVVFALIAAITGGAQLHPVTGGAVTAIGVLAITGGALVGGASTAAAVGYPLLLVVGLLGGRNRRTYRLQAEQSAAMVHQLQQLREKQQQVATLDERTRIAREIHDVLAHSLGALAIQIQTARVLLAANEDLPRALSILDGAQRMTTEGLTETRRAIHALRSGTQPLGDELADLAAAHREHHHSGVDLSAPGGRALAPEATVALLRVAQEALVNAAKHCPGATVTVDMVDAANQTILTISQPLTTAVPPRPSGSPTGGYGLIGMRERLLLLGGSLHVGPAGGRWAVVATVPR